VQWRTVANELKAPFDSSGQPTAGRRPSAVGRLLRATRLDELPQLLKVLLSMIGPRPLLPEDQPTNKSVRLLVRPGMIRWARTNKTGPQCIAVA
jgi:lipopolysaccharide/colanic/teichoic acid biosynthesis glycosyltransferase